MILVLAGCILSYWTMRRTRDRHLGQSGRRPLIEMLRVERARVDAQIRLLENVLWWYIAPFAVGVLLVVAGTSGASWFTIGYGAFVAALSWGIYHLNQHAVRHELRPRRDELTHLIRQTEE